MDLKTKLKMYEGAKEILKDRKHWTKGTYAQVGSPDGTFLATAMVYDEEANNFCLIGALGRSIAENKLSTRPDYEYIQVAKFECDELAGCVPHPRNSHILSNADRVISFNDKKTTRHSMVLKALDCAIDAVKTAMEKTDEPA